MFSFLSRSFSSRISAVVQLLLRCNSGATGGGKAIGDEFEEITCSSPELAGETEAAATGSVAAVTVAAAVTIAAAAIVAVDADTAGEIFRR